MESMIWVQILDKVVWVLLCTTAFGKDINTSFSQPSDMHKY